MDKAVIVDSIASRMMCMVSFEDVIGWHNMREHPSVLCAIHLMDHCF